ncbi:MAG: hypothetical protein M3336_18145, partial [Chloroflexota bacterium]|nr:hypothetical protein [Chloroflexota bacterium]
MLLSAAGLFGASGPYAALTATVRVVGMTYAVLGGVAAVSLLALAAVVPVSPALQQATEPARQAVSDLVQPTGDTLAVLVGNIAVQVERPPTPTSVPSVTVIDLPPPEFVDGEGVADSPPPIDRPRGRATLFDRPAATAIAPTPIEAPEEVPAADDQAAPAPPLPVRRPPLVVPAAPPAQVMASEAPRPLPTPPEPTPTETASQA